VEESSKKLKPLQILDSQSKVLTPLIAGDRSILNALRLIPPGGTRLRSVQGARFGFQVDANQQVHHLPKASRNPFDPDCPRFSHSSY